MRTRTLLALLVLAVAAVTAWKLWPSEERKVRSRLEALAAAARVPPNETGLARAARAAGVRQFFAEDVDVQLPAGAGQALHGRDEIVGLAARMPVPPGGAKIELFDVTIEMGPEGDRADVRLNARMVTAEPRDAPQILDARMIALTLSKADGRWVVASVRVMPTDDSLGVR